MKSHVVIIVALTTLLVRKCIVCVMDLMMEEEWFYVKIKIVVVALGSILNVSILLETLQVYGIALTKINK